MFYRIMIWVWSLLLMPGVFSSPKFFPLEGEGRLQGWAERSFRQDFQGDYLPKNAIARLGTIRLRQTSQLLSIAYSPDGKTLASRTVDGTVHLWNADSGEQLWVHHFGEPGSGRGGQVVFTADGKKMATVGREGVHLWDQANKKSTRLSDSSVPISFSPDSKLAVGAINRDLVIFDLQTCSVKFHLERLKDFTCTVAFSPNGTLVATWKRSFPLGTPSIIKLWDVSTGKQTGELIGHQELIKSLNFSPDGKLLITADPNINVRPCLWDLARSKEIATVDHPAASLAVFSPNRKLLATSDDYCVRLWDTTTWKETRSIQTAGTFSWQRALAFSPDGKKLATGGMSNALQIWDVETGKELLSFSGHHYAIASVQFSPDGKILASQGADRTVHLWDLTGKKDLRRLRLATEDLIPLGKGKAVSGCCLAFSPDCRTLIADAGIIRRKPGISVHFWDTASGRCFRDLHTPGIRPSVVALSPDGQVLATTYGGSIQLWSTASGTLLRKFFDEVHRPLGCAAFVPDGRTLATGGISINKDVNARLLLWDWANGRIIREFQSTKHGATYLSLSRNGYLLASCLGGIGNLKDNTIQIHDPATGTLIRTLEGHGGNVSSVSFSPNDRLLASACPIDGTIRIWDVLTGKELAQFTGHRGPVYCVAFSPDGKTVASGSADTTILLWDVSKLQPEASPAIPRHELAKELPRLWDEMQAKEGAKAYDAIWHLLGAGDEAAAFLGQKLQPVAAPDAKLLKQAIADLESDDFAKREAANTHLKKLGELAEPALRQALQGKPSLEARKRIENLLAEINEGAIAGREPRQLRALHALELIGSPAARAVFKKLAAGAPGARLTRDAKLALQRLERRPSP